MQSSFESPEILIILLLVGVVAFGWLATRIRVSYPIVLVVGGLAVSLLPGLPRYTLSPEVVFFGVLPPLLFAAAFVTSWRDFRYHLVSICLLAFGLVAFTVVGVALIAEWILPDFNWQLGLVLGAVVATTDAIAATSIARRVGLPQRFIDILEGESLLNDASGLLALEFAVAAVVNGHAPSPMEGLQRLSFLVIGGVGIGLLVGKLVYLVERHIDNGPIEITISLITPYVAYLSAESANTSGVLAAVACGLFLGRRSVTYFSSAVRIEAWSFWSSLTFILNGLVFILIGLQLPGIYSRIENFSLLALLARGMVFSAAVILLRFIWVYPGAYVAYFIRTRLLRQRESLPTPGGIFVVSWTGMRGVVALAAAISLPADLPQRDLILFLTFCVIFVTLVLQGLTLPALIRRLSLPPQEMSRCEALEARTIMINAALKAIEEAPERSHPEFREIYDDVASHYQSRLSILAAAENDESGDTHNEDRFELVARRLRDRERAVAIELRDQDRINDEVLRDLLRELDLQDVRQIGGSMNED